MLNGRASRMRTLLIVAGGLLLAGLWYQRRGSRLLREQIRQERAIFNLKSYAEKIVASVPSGLLVLASDLRILSANRSFLESFSLQANAVLGRRFDEGVDLCGTETLRKNDSEEPCGPPSGGQASRREALGCAFG